MVKEKNLTHNLTAYQNTNTQIAFDIFSLLDQENKTIDESTHEIGYKKNNIFLNIPDLSLSARRALDVAYFIVSQQENYAPIHISVDDRYFEVDLQFFKWLMGYSSRNHQHLKQCLLESQSNQIQLEKLDQNTKNLSKWISIPLMGAIDLSEGKIRFELTPSLVNKIKQPEQFHFLSLRSVFKSLSSKLLFDYLQSYIKNNNTPWVTIDELRNILNANAKSYSEFKSFNRHVLKTAVQEINEITSLNIDYQTQAKESRKTSHLRFTIKHKIVNPTQEALQALKGLYYELHDEFGLTNKQFDQLVANRDIWSEERIRNAMHYTRNQVSEKETKIRSLPAYLMKAISEGYRLGKIMEDELNIQNDFKQLEKEGKLSSLLDPLHPTTKNVTEFENTFSIIDDEIQAEGWSFFTTLDRDKRAYFIKMFSEDLTIKSYVVSLKIRSTSQDIQDNLLLNPDLQKAFGTYIYRLNKSQQKT